MTQRASSASRIPGQTAASIAQRSATTTIAAASQLRTSSPELSTGDMAISDKAARNGLQHGATRGEEAVSPRARARARAGGPSRSPKIGARVDLALASCLACILHRSND